MNQKEFEELSKNTEKKSFERCLGDLKKGMCYRGEGKEMLFCQRQSGLKCMVWKPEKVADWQRLGGCPNSTLPPEGSNTQGVKKKINPLKASKRRNR